MPSPAARFAGALALEIGERAAAAWVHAAALVRHAAMAGLITELEGDPAAVIRHSLTSVTASHPALEGFADPAVVPVWDEEPSADLAARLITPWLDADLDDSRFCAYPLGDLYQELSAEARKGRALCQTPAFVSDLLLELSWKEAVRERGDGVTMIDPACGTGHILMEALIRAGAPGSLDQAERALGRVHGTDIDPYAVLIARYRMLAGICQWGGRSLELREVPRSFVPQVACADSLLSADEPLLERGRYHCVVANPPYITCKDPAQNEAIRARYRQVCSGKFAMSVPFEVLMHELAAPGGWVARITSNSFMKREFGKKLIEDYLTAIDLRWVIDTSGAYIPGHGTPTVILASRNQPPSSPTVQAVLGVKGEPSAPADPAKGLVWTAIRNSVRERSAFMRLAAAIEAQQPAEPPAPVPSSPVTQGTLFDLLQEVAA